jgi:acyl-CoA reductase-like NAD-dependent aldehyde dehydrogenase
VELVLGELWEAAALPTQPWGHLLPTSEAGRQSIAKRVPLGVVGVISPWNFPQILSVRAVAPALAPGNAVVLKPDVQTAVSGGVLIARLFELAGLPQGVLHVLAGVTPLMAAFREEIFGPVAPVIVVKDADEAVRVANDTEYGLVAAIQTGSVERGLELAERLNTGIVHVNDQTLNNDAFAPFGGTGASGNGSRFGSQSSWDEFTQWQWVTSRPQAHGFPF